MDQPRESNLIHNHEPVSSSTDLTTSPHSDSDPLLPVQPHSWSLAQKLRTSLPNTSTSSNWKKQLQCTALYRSLDRVNVLGSSTTGHTGCVCLVTLGFQNRNKYGCLLGVSMLSVGREAGICCWVGATIRRAFSIHTDIMLMVRLADTSILQWGLVVSTAYDCGDWTRPIHPRHIPSYAMLLSEQVTGRIYSRTICCLIRIECTLSPFSLTDYQQFIIFTLCIPSLTTRKFAHQLIEHQ